MKQIKLSGLTYNLHPVYDSYGSTESGHIIDFNKKANVEGYRSSDYYAIVVRGPNFHLLRLYEARQFVYECFNGVIPKNTVVRNIDNNGFRNDLSNLKLVMQGDDHIAGLLGKPDVIFGDSPLAGLNMFGKTGSRGCHTIGVPPGKGLINASNAGAIQISTTLNLSDASDCVCGVT